jgi:hypothetical protein
MSTIATVFNTDSIAVMPWTDRVTDAVGHDARSPYVERFWLPVLGPSTVWLLRRMAGELDRSPDGFEMDLVDTARSLGLANNPGRNGPFCGALIRLVQFGAAQYVPGGLAVRRRLAFLPVRHLERLTPALQDEHRRWVDADERGTQQTQRRRAYSLALTLLRLEEQPDEVHWQLTQWRFSSALCEEAVSWARQRCQGEPNEAA